MNWWLFVKLAIGLHSGALLLTVAYTVYYYSKQSSLFRGLMFSIVCALLGSITFSASILLDDSMYVVTSNRGSDAIQPLNNILLYLSTQLGINILLLIMSIGHAFAEQQQFEGSQTLTIALAVICCSAFLILIGSSSYLIHGVRETKTALGVDN